LALYQKYGFRIIGVDIDFFIALIREDRLMMEILDAAKTLNLPDWWICAGFVRSKVWDITDFSVRTTIPDIDVIYFNPTNKRKNTYGVL
jgi:hypothetical protein